MGEKSIKAKLPAMRAELQSPTFNGPKACLITGAADRLGRTIALAMADAGWDVAIHYRQSETKALELKQLLEAKGRNAVLLRAELNDPAQAKALVEQASSALANLCCVINNASAFEFDRPERLDTELATRLFAVNTLAPSVLTQTLYQHLLPKYKTGSDPLGVVIHLLDQKLVNPNPDFFSYTLSKSALQEAMRLQAMAFAPVMRVVGIAPGLTLPSGDQTPEEFEKTRTMTPLGGTSRPSEIADAAVWLAQARAVTGTMLLVDGGQHLLAQPRDVMMMVRT
jgi:NAD(P)-dependent dehydrogenase (short-subunit alcohol dehydrogenase family)